jgi:hypothetical protein
MPIGEKLMHADCCRCEGRLLEAKAVCRQVLESQPNMPETEHLLGLIAHQTGKLGEAIETYGARRSLHDKCRFFTPIWASCIDLRGASNMPLKKRDERSRSSQRCRLRSAISESHFTN